MIVNGYINIYTDGKSRWTGSDIYDDLEAAKVMGARLSRLGGKVVKCVGTFYINFDDENPTANYPLPPIKEDTLEDTSSPRQPRRGRPRSTKIHRIGKSDKREET